MEKSSKKKSGRISAIVLLPVIAVIFAIPVLLTILVEAPIGSGSPPVEASVEISDEASVTADDSASAGFVDSDFIPASPALPDGSASDASELPDFSVPSREESAGTGQNDAESDSPAQAENTDIPAPPCTLDDIPPYSGELYTVINDHVPFFQAEDIVTESFERYAALDSLGRCGTAFANVGPDLMPTEERGAIGHIRPSGWHTVKYDGIDGNYLYNRCHLIAYQLSGENANERNLITGTRYFNAEGMIVFEEMVGDYVRETGCHVLYRVTPMFRGNNLVADGVLMEAWSVEDNGGGICFNVFVYNVQPGIVIDYATGDSHAADELYVVDGVTSPADSDDSTAQDNPNGSGTDYVLNTNTKKFHYPGCSSVQDMAEHNKRFYTGKREDVIAMGYVPCKRCNP